MAAGLMAAAAMTGVLAAPGAMAQQTATLFASGLSNPSKIITGPGGTLLAAETGATPNSGVVSVIAPSGTRSVLLDGLPSGLSVPNLDPDGPNGLLLDGNTLYIAGHIGIDSKTGQPPVSPEDEARLVMDMTKQTVESAGMSMDDVVSIQIFCTDLKLYETFNAVYKTYFHGKFPARAFIGTNKLLRDGRFEVTGIAVKK